MLIHQNTQGRLKQALEGLHSQRKQLTNWDDYSGLESIQNILLLCHFAIYFAAFLTI